MERRGSGASSPPTWVQAIANEGGNGETAEIESWIQSLSSDGVPESPGSHADVYVDIPRKFSESEDDKDLQRTDRAESIEAINSMENMDSKRVAVPRISLRSSPRSSIFDGYFSATAPKTHPADLPLPYSEAKFDLELQRLKDFEYPVVNPDDVSSVSEEVQVAHSDLSGTNTAPISVDGLIAAFRGSGMLCVDLTDHNDELEKGTLAALDCTLGFLRRVPNGVMHLRDSAAYRRWSHSSAQAWPLGDDGEDESVAGSADMSFCTLMCTASAPLMQSQVITARLIYILVELSLDDVLRSSMGPSMSCSDNGSGPCEVTQRALTVHGTSCPLIAEMCLLLVCRLCCRQPTASSFADSKSSRDYFNSALVVRYLMESVLAFTTRRPISELACKAICCLATSESSRSSLVEAGALKALEGIIGHHATSSEAVIEWACRAIYCLMTDHPANREATRHTALCSLLVGTGLKNTVLHSPDIIRWGCRAVGNVSFQCATAKQLLGDAGACEAIVSILELEALGNVEIAESACWALSSVATGHQSNQSRLVTKEGSVAVLLAMRIHNTSVAVLRESCICLTSLIKDNSTLCDSFLGVTDVADVLMKRNADLEMKQKQRRKYPFAEEMIPFVWYALAGLAAFPSGRSQLNSNEFGLVLSASMRSVTDVRALRWMLRCVNCYAAENGVSFVQLGAWGVCASVATALKRSVTYPPAVYEGCVAIGRLATDTENRKTLGIHKACQVIAQVLHTYEHDVRVVGAALLAVVNLSADHDKNVNKLLSCGVCKAIPRAMIRHECGDVALALWGFKAITVLANMKDGVHRLSAHGACRVLGMGFNTHIYNLAVLKTICQATAKLALNEKSRALLQSYGACAMLVNIVIILLQEPREESLVGACLHAIRNMLLDPDLVGQFGSLGLGEIAFNLVDAYPRNALLTQMSLDIVNQLINHSDANRNRLEKCNVCACLQIALTEHAKSSTHVYVACSTICSLLRTGASVEERNGSSPSDHQRRPLPSAVEAIYFRLCELGVGATLCHVLNLHLQCDIGEDALVKCVCAIGRLAEIFNFLHGQGELAERYQRHIEMATPGCNIDMERGAVELCAITTLCESGVCDYLVEILNLYCDDDDCVMETSLLTCALLAEKSGDCKIRFGQSGVCEVISRVLGSYDHCSMKTDLLHFLAVRVVHAITMDCFGNALRLLALGVIAHLERIADMHKNSERLGWVICLAVASLSHGHNMTNLAIFHTVCTAMQKFVKSERVCIAGCGAIAEINVGADATCAAFSSTVLLLSRVVVAVLARHMSSADVCRGASVALSVMLQLYDSGEAVSAVGDARGAILRVLSGAGVCKYLVYIYLRHSADASVMLSTSQFVFNITLPPIDHDQDAVNEVLEQFRAVGVCNAVMAALKSHANNTCVLAISLRALSNLAQNRYNKAQLGGSANCLFVVNTLHMHHQSDGVIAAACQLIEVLSDGDRKSALFLAEGGACECVVWALDTFSSHLQIARYGCGAVGSMAAADRDIQRQFGESRACEIVCVCLSRHYSDEVAAARGCMAIGSLAEKNKANIELLASHGACGAVLAAMEQHRNSLLVGWTSCRALNFLSSYILSNTSSGVKPVSVSVSTVRQAVTEAAAQWASSDIMALWSGRALNAVCVQSGKSQLDAKLSSEPESRTFEVVVQSLLVHIRSRADIIEENILSIANMLTVDVIKYPAEDICQHLQTAMSLHGNNSGIYIACCKAIRALQSQADEVASCGIPHTILEIMRKHPKNDLVAQWGCEAIASMAVDAKNRDTLVASGACETVIRALQRGTGSDALVAVVLQKSIGNQALGLAACRAVHSLGHGSDAYGERLGANGACEGVAKILLKYADNEDVAATGCQAIVTLAQNNNSNKSKLGNAGACKLIATLLETHRTSEPVAIWGCRAVEIMVDGHDGNTIRMGSEGVCDAVAIAMQSHQAVAEVAGAGCGAVAGMCLHKKCISRFREAGACELVLFAIHLCFFDIEIVKKACLAVSRLAGDRVNCTQMLGADVVTALMCIVCRHNAHADLSAAVWMAIASLVTNCPDAAKRFMEVDVCPILVSRLQHISEATHLEYCGVVEECLKVVQVLAAEDGNLQKFKDSSLVDCVQRMEQFYGELQPVKSQLRGVKQLVLD